MVIGNGRTHCLVPSNTLYCMLSSSLLLQLAALSTCITLLIDRHCTTKEIADHAPAAGMRNHFRRVLLLLLFTSVAEVATGRTAKALFRRAGRLALNALLGPLRAARPRELCMVVAMVASCTYFH